MRHMIIDYYDCQYLGDPVKINKIFWEAAETLKAERLKFEEHFFDNGGYTGIFLLAESHFSIHTWPEKNFCSVDYFSCNEKIDNEFMKVLLKLEYKSVSVRIITRGECLE